VQKRFMLLIVIMAVLSPLGLIAEGTAWGEWGTEELQEMLGFVPQGVHSAGIWWKAVMPDYTIEALGQDFPASALAYIIAAVVGSAVSYALIMMLGKRLVKTGRHINGNVG